MRLVESRRNRVHKIKRKSLAGQGVLVLIALQALLITSFVAFSLPTGTGHNLLNVGRVQVQAVADRLPQPYQKRFYNSFPEAALPVAKIRYDMYTPEAPVAVFLGYVMGVPVATIAAILFLFIGLVGPAFHVYLFASGGGIDYYSQPGFGYLVGMILATWVAGKITDGPRTSLRQIGAVVAGLGTLHVTGIAYILGCSLAFAFSDPATNPEWLPWVFEQIRNMSWYPLPYDAIFAIMLIAIGFPIRYLVHVLTAPDIGLKTRSDVMAQQQLEEILQ